MTDGQGLPLSLQVGYDRAVTVIPERRLLGLRCRHVIPGEVLGMIHGVVRREGHVLRPARVMGEGGAVHAQVHVHVPRAAGSMGIQIPGVLARLLRTRVGVVPCVAGRAV